MATSLILATAILNRKRKREDVLRRYGIDSLPQILVDALSKTVDVNGEYVQTTMRYNIEQIEFASQYIPAIPPNELGHCDIDCITSKSAFAPLCGFSFEKFDRLFYSLRQPLEYIFPRCKVAKTTIDTVSKFCTRRMKLFLFCVRCKLATLFKQMEGLFGWCDSSQQEWFIKLSIAIPKVMYAYNEGFLSFKGEAWQRAAALEWTQTKLREGTFDLFLE